MQVLKHFKKVHFALGPPPKKQQKNNNNNNNNNTPLTFFYFLDGSEVDICHGLPVDPECLPVGQQVWTAPSGVHDPEDAEITDRLLEPGAAPRDLDQVWELLGQSRGRGPRSTSNARSNIV